MALQVEPLAIQPADSPDGAGDIAMLLTDVGDPQNVGSVIRSAAYFGLPRLYLAERCATPTPVVSKGSAGSLEFYHPQMRLCRRTGAFLDAAKRDGWLILGTGVDPEDDPAAVAPADSRLGRRRRLVVMGGEGEGLAPSILRRCDAVVTIRGSSQAVAMGLDSLNVGVAAALLLQAALRPAESGDSVAFIKMMPAG